MSTPEPRRDRDRPAASSLAPHWGHDPSVVFLNHGSFGATPRIVLERVRDVQARLEREPVRFFVEDAEGLLDEARASGAAFVGADPEGFAFVHNATMGVSTVVRSLRLEPGDELLTNDHEYNACQNALRWAEERFGVRVVVPALPWPHGSDDEITEAVVARAGPRTRLALLSHITSPSATILPVPRIVRELALRGVDTLLDGAHAPGQIDLDVGATGAAYYTGNFHKWTCAAKGCAFLWVRPDRRDAIRPLVISHGANSMRTDRSRFRLEFDYTGTMDVAPWVTLPEALRALPEIASAPWAEIRRRNHELAVTGARAVADALRTSPVLEPARHGAMALVRLPDRDASETGPTRYADPLQDRLLTRWGIQVPIIPFTPAGAAPGTRYVRISAQLYNTPEQYRYLGEALRSELAGRLTANT